MQSRRRFLSGLLTSALSRLPQFDVLARALSRLPITRGAFVVVRFGGGKTSQFIGLAAAGALKRRRY
jgi:hypothetical protein